MKNSQITTIATMTIIMIINIYILNKIMTEINCDLIPYNFLSFWIVIYSVAYYLKIVTFNPLILVYISLLFVLVAVIIILLNYNENTILLYFLTINLGIKIPVLLLVWNNKINKDDIVFTILVLLFYIYYIKLIGLDVYKIYKEYIEFIIDTNKGAQAPIYNYLNS
jgi:hypothetical protein